MNDQELRALVRAAVERHLGAHSGAPATGYGLPAAGYRLPATGTPQFAATAPVASSLVPVAGNVSHYVYVSLTNASDACVIEPDVPCTHCNYCKSHGH